MGWSMRVVVRGKKVKKNFQSQMSILSQIVFSETIFKMDIPLKKFFLAQLKSGNFGIFT
jgi:hypothetical protein